MNASEDDYDWEREYDEFVAFLDEHFKEHSMEKEWPTFGPPGMESYYLYVVGGDKPPTGFPTKSDRAAIERYSFRDGCWIEIESRTSWAPPRFYGSQVALFAGDIWVVGGGMGLLSMSCVYAFNPRTHVWKTVLSMHKGRRCFGMTVLGNKLYVAGGITGELEVHNDMEYYDLKYGVWMQGNGMLSRRCQFALVAAGNNLYAIGGRDRKCYISTMEMHCTVSGQWSSLTRVTFGPHKWLRAGVIGHFIYALTSGDAINVSAFNTVTGQWVHNFDLEQRNRRFSLITCESSIFVIGGHQYGKVLQSVLYYDTHDKKWHDLPGMKSPRLEPGVVVVRRATVEGSDIKDPDLSHPESL